LRGERADDGSPLVLWLTQRLFVRVLPVVMKWLENDKSDVPRAEVLQDFAQQAARAKMAPQPPVQIDASTDDWLINAVDVGSNDQIIRLTFKSGSEQSAYLTFTSQQLRQWLSIIYAAWMKAGWTGDLWPSWVQESHPPTKPQPTVLH